MRLYRSSFNIFQVLLFFIVGFALMGALAVFTFHIYLKEVTDKNIFTQILFLIFSVGLPAFVSVYAFISMASKMPVVKLYRDRIDVNNLFSRKTFMLSEIKQIYFGKVPFKFIIPYPTEGIVLITKSDEEIFVYDLYYFNTDKLKLILSQFLDKKHQLTSKEIINIEPYKRERVRYSEVRFNNFLTYKGLWWLNLSGIAIIFITILPFAIALVKGQGFKMPILVYVGLVGFFYLIFGYQLHYFKLTDNYLLVQHHIWLWREKIYNIEEIKEVVIEQPDKFSISLRVITKEYKSKLYPAGSLTKKHWKELKQKLQSLDILVRDEVYLPS